MAKKNCSITVERRTMKRITVKQIMALLLAMVITWSGVPVEIQAEEQTGQDAPELWTSEQEVNGLTTLPEDPEFVKLLEQEQEGLRMSSVQSLTGATYTHNARFADCTVRNGIDVSYYQGNIDWNAVKSSGVEFVFVRVGYRGYSTGQLAMDTKAMDNLRGAINAGLKVGAYIFSQASTPQEAREEAQYALNQVSGFSISMPIVIDYEYAATGVGRLYNANLSREQATQIVNTFCEYINQAGYEPMIYANKSMLETSLNAGSIPHKIWLANYTTKTQYQGAYEFWQYSSRGTVNGISGNVDSNFWYDSAEENYTKTIENGIYIIESALQKDKVVDVNGGVEDNGANIQLWTRNDNSSQKFKVMYEGDGTYSIMALCSKKYLDAENGGNTQGTNVIQYQSTNGKNQRWHIKDEGDGTYSIISASSGLYLDVYDNRTADGTNIQLWFNTGGNAQRFRFLTATDSSQGGDNENQDSPEARNGWYTENGKKYWYDNGVMARDKEAYDPASDAWYWFDADGTMATDKDVFIPTNAERTEGKWVRYDSNGWMVKGEDYRYGGWYWFDPTTGEMMKGFVHIPVVGDSEGKWVYYDEIDGQMHHGESCINGNWYYFDDYTGKMVHGEYQRNGNWYYYDQITGIMAHGWTTLPDGRYVYYDDITGIRR